MADTTDQTQSGPGDTQPPAQREAAKTNAPLTRFPEDEARLKSVRPAIENPPANITATNSALTGTTNTGQANDLITQRVVDILTSLATDPFALIKLNTKVSQPLAPDNNSRLATRTPSPPVENVPNNSTPQPPLTNSTGTAISPNAGASALDLAIPQSRPPVDLGNLFAAGQVPELSQPSSARSGSGFATPSDMSSSTADVQAQALQVSGARIQSTLEQNTQLTVSLFDQVRNLLEAQNGALAEMGRKISELGGQIKSLKNP